MGTDKECGKVEQLLELFLDGELPAGEQMRVKEELATCRECRAEFERLQKLRALVREVYVDQVKSANLDEVLPGVMARIGDGRRSWLTRLQDWLDKYRLGLASPVAPVGVAATVAVAIMAATLIYVSTGPTSAPGQMRQAGPVADQEASAVVADEGVPDVAKKAAADNAKLTARRRPRHEERPFRKNECYITYYKVESGTVVVDVDPEGEVPTVVWHFADDPQRSEEDNRI